MDDDLGVAWLVKRLIVSKILKSRAAPDIADVDGAVLEANTAGRLVWASMVPAIVKKLVGQGDLESEMAAEYTHRLGEDLDNVSAKALKQGYNASLGKGIDRSLSWARVAEAWGLDGRQMRAFIGTMPKNDYSGEIIPSRSRATLDTMINTRADRIRDNESYAISQMAEQVHWIKLRETGEIGPDVTKRWHTAVDEHTCVICGPINGKIVGLTKTFSRGVFSPPVHPNCRCWVELLEGSTVVTKRDYDRDKKGRFAAQNTLAHRFEPSDRVDLNVTGPGRSKKILDSAIKERGYNYYPTAFQVRYDDPKHPEKGGIALFAGHRNEVWGQMSDGDDIVRITDEHHGQTYDHDELVSALRDYNIDYTSYVDLVALGEPAGFRYGPAEKSKVMAYDIDGTINVGPFGNDQLNERMAQQIRNQKAQGYKIVYNTSRPEASREHTEKWLAHNNLPNDGLYMRSQGNVVSSKVINVGRIEDEIGPIISLWDDNPKARDAIIDSYIEGAGEDWKLEDGSDIPKAFAPNEPSSHPYGRDIGFHEGYPRPTAEQIAQAKANTRKLKGGKGGWDIVEGMPVDDEGNLLPGSSTINLKSSTSEQAWLLPTRSDRYYQSIYADWQDRNTPRELFTKDEYWNRLWERGTPYQHSLREDEIFTPEEIAAKKEELAGPVKAEPLSKPVKGQYRELSFEPKRGEHEAMAELPLIGYEGLKGFDRQGKYEPIKTQGGPTMDLGRGAKIRSHYVIDRRPDMPLWDSRALLMETGGGRNAYERKMKPGHHLPYDVIMTDPRPQHKPIWGTYDSQTQQYTWLPAGAAPPGWGLYMNVDFPMGWSAFYTNKTGKYRSHPSTSSKPPPPKFVKDDKALNNPFTPKGHKMPPVTMTQEIYKRLKAKIEKSTAVLEREYNRDEQGQFATVDVYRPKPVKPAPIKRAAPNPILLTPAQVKEIENLVYGKPPKASVPKSVDQVLKGQVDADRRRLSREYDNRPQPPNLMIGKKVEDVSQIIYDSKTRAGNTPKKKITPRYVTIEVDDQVFSVSAKPITVAKPMVVYLDEEPQGNTISFDDKLVEVHSLDDLPDAEGRVMVVAQGLTMHPDAIRVTDPAGGIQVKTNPEHGLAAGEYQITSTAMVNDTKHRNVEDIITIVPAGLLREGYSTGAGWRTEAPSPSRTGKEYDDPTRGSVRRRDLDIEEDEPDYNDVIDIDEDWEGDWDDEPKPRIKKPDKYGVDWNVEAKTNQFLRESGMREDQIRLRRLDRPERFRDD